nr:DNA replication complex gins protein psf2 [Cryptomonas curvata]
MQLKKSTIKEDIMRLEFLTEEIKVEVKFLRNITNITLLKSDLNFVKKNCIRKVSLWMAILLKNLGIVSILKPEWFNTMWLKKKILDEQEKEELQFIPYNYVELTYILYKKAIEIFDFPVEMINLVEILFQIRLSKIWKGIKKLKKNIEIIKLNKICSVELYSVKNIILLFFQLINDFKL